MTNYNILLITTMFPEPKVTEIYCMVNTIGEKITKSIKYMDEMQEQYTSEQANHGYPPQTLRPYFGEMVDIRSNTRRSIEPQLHIIANTARSKSTRPFCSS